MGKIAAMDVQTSSFTYLVWVTRANNVPSLAWQRSSPSPAILFVWFFGNFREASHGSRRDRQAEYYAHEDADNAGHNGHSTDNKQRRCFVLSCPSCPRRVRAFMSVSLSSAGPSLTIQGS